MPWVRRHWLLIATLIVLLVVLPLLATSVHSFPR